jgi:hypothetical protein
VVPERKWRRESLRIDTVEVILVEDKGKKRTRQRPRAEQEKMGKGIAESKLKMDI